MNPIIAKKIVSHLILNTLTRLRKAVFLTRLSISLLLGQVSVSLCSCAIWLGPILLNGRNVLYITMEMAEEKIAERIDANLLNIPIQDLTDLPKSSFENKVVNLSKKTQGSLIIKEYPTASAHSGHFKALLNELALKKSFRPDIIFIDYLNICASSRYKSGVSVNSYAILRPIAEEPRGLSSNAPGPYRICHPDHSFWLW